MVVKKPKTLSATMLILALALLCVLLRCGGAGGMMTGSMIGIVVDRVRATKTSWGGVLDCRIWPAAFWFEDTGSEGEGSMYPFRDEEPEPDEDRRWRSNVAVLSPEVDRPLLMGTPLALEGG